MFPFRAFCTPKYFARRFISTWQIIGSKYSSSVCGFNFVALFLPGDLGLLCWNLSTKSLDFGSASARSHSFYNFIPLCCWSFASFPVPFSTRCFCLSFFCLILDVFFWCLLWFLSFWFFYLCGCQGSAEVVKLNMALLLLSVCKNSMTYLRSTFLGHVIPFDDRIEFHKVKI